MVSQLQDWDLKRTDPSTAADRHKWQKWRNGRFRNHPIQFSIVPLLSLSKLHTMSLNGISPIYTRERSHCSCDLWVVWMS